MKYLFILFCFGFQTDKIPYKAADEFELKLEFQFKQRNHDSKENLMYEKVHHSGSLPFLFVHLNVLKTQEDEVRLKVVNNLEDVILSKKLDKISTVKFPLGFTDDLKDHVAAYQYFIYFISANKEIKRKIEILFEEDGTYLVNGEKRGKL